MKKSAEENFLLPIFYTKKQKKEKFFKKVFTN